MESVIRFVCIQCGKKLKARGTSAGTTLNCPECGNTCRVPGEEGSALPSSPAQAEQIAPTSSVAAAPSRKIWWIAGSILGIAAIIGAIVAVALPRAPDNPVRKQGDDADAEIADRDDQAASPTAEASSASAGSDGRSSASRFGGSFALSATALPQQPIPRGPFQEPNRGLVGVLGEGRFRHFGQVRNIALSPDGKYLASDTAGSALWMWDAETGTPLYVITEGSHHQFNALLTFSPDSRTLAVFGNENQEGAKGPQGVLRLIDARTGQTRVKRDGYMQFLPNNFGRPITLTFSPDGQLILLDMGQCFLVDAESGQDSPWMARFPLKPEQTSFQRSPLANVSFAPDGRFMAFGIAGVPGPNDPRNFITGNRVASDPYVVVDLESGKEILRIPDAKPFGIQIARRAPLLEVFDRTTFEFQVRNLQGQIQWKISTREKPGSYTILDDDRVVYFEARQKNLETTTSAHLLNFRKSEAFPISEPHTSTTNPQTFHVFGSRILGYTLYNPFRITFYDLNERKPLITIPVDVFPDWSEVTVSPNDRFVALMERSPRRDRSQLRVFDLTAGELIHTFEAVRAKGQKGIVQQVQFAPDDSRIYAAIGWTNPLRGEIAVWTLPEGQRQFQSPISPFDPGRVVFAPNGRALASGSQENGRIIVWNLADGVPRVVFGDGDDAGADPAGALAFSPDSSLLFSEDVSKCRMIELSAARPGVRFTRPGDNSGSAIFSADGSIVVSPEFLVETATGKDLGVLGIQTNNAALALQNFTFSPEFATAAGSAEAGVVTLLSLKTKLPSAVFKSPFGELAFLSKPLRLAVWMPAKRSLALIDLGQGADGLTYPGAAIQPNREYRDDKIVTAKYQTVVLEDDLQEKRGEHRRLEFIGGNRIAETRSVDGLLKVWNAHTGKLVFSAEACPPKPNDLGIDYNPFATLAGSYDGRYVAVALNNGQILIFDLTAKPLDPSDRPSPPAIAARPPVNKPALPDENSKTTSPSAKKTPPKPSSPPGIPTDELERRLRDLLQPKAKFDGKWSFEKYAGRVSFRVTAVTPDGKFEAQLFDPSKSTQTKAMLGRIVRAAGDDGAEVEWVTVRESGVRRAPSKSPATLNLILLGDQRTIRLTLSDDELTGTDSVGVDFTFPTTSE